MEASSDIFLSSLAPVTVLTGASLLLSVMVSRYGRTTDRIRHLLGEIRRDASLGAEDARVMRDEIRVLYRRARLIRTELSLSVAGILCLVVTCILLFLSHFWAPWLRDASLVVFVACLAMLGGSQVLLIVDVLASLRALKLRVDHEQPGLIER